MKKLFMILPVIMVICVAFAPVFAISADNLNDVVGGGSGATGITKAAKNIWSTIVTIVQMLAVAAVVFAGVRYMFASADQKADIKKSMGILAIGAILVFGSTVIIQLIAGATSIFNVNQ